MLPIVRRISSSCKNTSQCHLKINVVLLQGGRLKQICISFKINQLVIKQYTINRLQSNRFKVTDSF